MDVSNMTKSIIGIIVSIVIVVTVAIPIIGDVNSTGDTEITGTNSGQLYNMSVVTDGSEVVWEYIAAGQYTINSESYTAAGSTWADANVLFAEGIIITIHSGGAQIQTDKTGAIVAAVGDTVTCSDGTWTFTDTSASQSYTGSYSTVAFRDDDGDYGYWTVSGTANVNVSDDSMIYGFLRSDASKAENESLCTFISGRVGDLTAQGGWCYSSETPTEVTGAITVSTAIQSEHEYYDTISRISIENGGTRYSTNLVAPLEYTEDIIEEEGAVHTIIGVVPILLIVGVLMGVVSAFMLRRT